MLKKNEEGPRARIAHIFRILLEQPHRYTIRELADKLAVSTDTIKGDFEAIRTSGYQIERDEKDRYAFILEKPYQQLKDLLHFSEEDQAYLYQAIDNLPIGSGRTEKLKAKLGSLYDYGRLGHAYLRKPYLSKVDLLEKARLEKKQVVLVGYHSSNSSQVGDRIVEAFHIMPAEDMLHAYDPEKHEIRHFRISRFVRAEILLTAWQYEGHHNIMRTDPFRIVTNDQISVHLRLSVGAYNELTERYPLTKAYIEATGNPNFFDFQCHVNKKFLGLSNFILGFYHLDIEVIAPEVLRDHLRTEVARMNF